MKTTARMFKALSDETRLRILSLLLEGELCVCDLMAVLQLPQSTVSRHLAYLKNASWEDDRRCGIWIYYSILETDSEPHKSILCLLRSVLPNLGVSASDRQRLRELCRSNNCA